VPHGPRSEISPKADSALLFSLFCFSFFAFSLQPGRNRNGDGGMAEPRADAGVFQSAGRLDECGARRGDRRGEREDFEGGKTYSPGGQRKGKKIA
jgi:hypothetical protein